MCILLQIVSNVMLVGVDESARRTAKPSSSLKGPKTSGSWSMEPLVFASIPSQCRIDGLICFAIADFSSSTVGAGGHELTPEIG